MSKRKQMFDKRNDEYAIKLQRLLDSTLRQERVIRNIERKLFVQNEQRFILSTRYPNPKLNHFWNYRTNDEFSYGISWYDSSTALDSFNAVYLGSYAVTGFPQYSGLLNQYFDISIPNNFWTDLKNKGRNQNSTSQYLMLRNMEITRASSEVVASQLEISSIQIVAFSNKQMEFPNTLYSEQVITMFRTSLISDFRLGDIYESTTPYPNDPLKVVVAMLRFNQNNLFEPAGIFTTLEQANTWTPPPIGSYFVSQQLHSGGSLGITWYVPEVGGYVKVDNVISSPLYTWPCSENQQSVNLLNFEGNYLNVNTSIITDERNTFDTLRSVMKTKFNTFQMRSISKDFTKSLILMEWMIDQTQPLKSLIQLRMATTITDIIRAMDDQFDRVPSPAIFPLYAYNANGVYHKQPQTDSAEKITDGPQSISIQLDFPDILETVPILLNSTLSNNFPDSENPSDSQQTTTYSTTFGIYSASSIDYRHFSYNNENSNSYHAHPLRNNFLGIANNSTNGSLQQQNLRLEDYQDLEQSTSTMPLSLYKPSQQQPLTNYLRFAISESDGSHVHYGLLDYSFTFDFGIIFD